MENRSRKTMAVGVALAALLLFAWAGIGAANPPVSQDKPVKATGDVKPPKIVNQVQPVYPEDAKKQGIEGTVILEATADIKGKVQEVKVLRGVEGLNQAAVDAVKQWTYEPMMIDGKPKPVVFTVAVQFKLDDKGAKRAGEGQEPKIVKKVDPVYPEDARKQGIEGTVILEATADIEGRVQEVKVLRGVEGLNQAAVDAVKQWTYEPMMIDGKPKPVVFTVAVQFKLDDKGAKRAGEGQEPKIVRKVDPVYPEGARKQGLEGDVIIEATVDEAGKVKEAKVLRGVDELNQAALDAVKQWTYEPMMIDGKPKAVKFTVTIRFKLA